MLHEFAHQLDMMNGGQVDGTPPLDTPAQRKRCRDVLQPVFERLHAEAPAAYARS
nr:zinc-dependent peptidase [Planctomycetota bacterium]